MPKFVTSHFETALLYLDIVHKFMYIEYMKKRDLENKMKANGWWFLRHGGNHDTWTNGKDIEQVPRHREINENLARKIIRTAQRNPG